MAYLGGGALDQLRRQNSQEKPFARFTCTAARSGQGQCWQQSVPPRWTLSTIQFEKLLRIIDT